ncbi:MAG: hypothetical protein KF774_17685 [Planctomyces sp.]|nr:hypothetical protein [Planctomyces sp.]
MNRFQAQRIMDAFVLCVCPAVQTFLVCGSIRRQAPTVNDGELVVIPKFGPPANRLFDNGEQVSLIEARVERLVAEGYCRFDTKTPRNGSRYKRLVKDGLAIDLFIVLPPAEFGVITALRTGPAHFSRQLVTPREAGGFLPLDCRIHDGQLLRRGQLVPTPSERELFEALGMPWIDPENRGTYAPFSKGARPAAARPAFGRGVFH